MGIVFIFTWLSAFIAFLILGMLAMIRHHKQIKSGLGGSWLAFFVIAIIVFIITIQLAMLSFPQSSLGAPSEHDIHLLMLSSILFGSAPGLALITGALNALFLKNK